MQRGVDFRGPQTTKKPSRNFRAGLRASNPSDPCDDSPDRQMQRIEGANNATNEEQQGDTRSVPEAAPTAQPPQTSERVQEENQGRLDEIAKAMESVRKMADMLNQDSAEEAPSKAASLARVHNFQQASKSPVADVRRNPEDRPQETAVADKNVTDRADSGKKPVEGPFDEAQRRLDAVRSSFEEQRPPAKRMKANVEETDTQKIEKDLPRFGTQMLETQVEIGVENSRIWADELSEVIIQTQKEQAVRLQNEETYNVVNEILTQEDGFHSQLEVDRIRHFEPAQDEEIQLIENVDGGPPQTSDQQQEKDQPLGSGRVLPSATDIAPNSTGKVPQQEEKAKTPKKTPIKLPKSILRARQRIEELRRQREEGNSASRPGNENRNLGRVQPAPFETPQDTDKITPRAAQLLKSLSPKYNPTSIGVSPPKGKGPQEGRGQVFGRLLSKLLH